MSEIKTGRYQHYKGAYYEVVGLARHSETLEELVIYKALYETKFGYGSWWVRPKSLFLQKVKVDGIEKPRFVWVGPG